MTHDQYRMLSLLERIGPASCDRLSKLIDLDSTRCSEICRQLVKRGKVSVVGGTAMRRLYQSRSRQKEDR